MTTASPDHPDIPDYLRLPFDPIADPQAVVAAPNVRFTVLTSRLVRMEYSPNGQFEDRPSQAFWYRRQPAPEFNVLHTGKVLQIETDHLQLRYTGQGQAFAPDNLSVQVKTMGAVWRYATPDHRNLRGAARTLDGVNGRTRLEPGLMSRAGFAAVDDSKTLVFDTNGWLEPRAHLENLDLYFFGYAHDYPACLQDYHKVTGSAPLVPRWILGNWWSRYWPYSQQELRDLMADFERHEIPLSVCIIDMDWHIVQQGSQSFWTGYTWNRELWPDPQGFTAWLHRKGLHTALNLHPADGVQPHEEQYPAMARWMGIDPSGKQGVPFDCADPHYMRGYFELLHHPLEAQGIDFWWLDWQQGQSSKLPGLDPLWWLNHLHFYDLGRDSSQRQDSRRPFIFSRWGGLGNHRYPIGFSGDTVVSWESLAFQPYFTATAANVGYGWWSHDIGGHMAGLEDTELFARWVQYGVFSPIFRLHSTQNAYQDRRPWTMDAETFNVVRRAMQLRHQLIPYLYSMAWRNVVAGLPPITPLYYAYPEHEDAYRCPNQYFFGSELIAAPYVSPQHAETRLSKQAIWLPPGEWFHFFRGERFASPPGGRWLVQHGGLEDIPLFARAGAIVPLGACQPWGGVEVPESLVVYAFPGADGHFDLFEDDGNSNAFRRGAYSLIAFQQTWQENHLEFNILPQRVLPDAHAHLPQRRAVELRFANICRPEQIQVLLNAEPIDVFVNYLTASETLVLDGILLAPSDELKVRLANATPLLCAGRDRRAETLRKYLRCFRIDNDLKAQIDADLEAILAEPQRLWRYAGELSDAQLGALWGKLTT